MSTKKQEGKRVDLYRVKATLGSLNKVYRNGHLLGKVPYWYAEDYCEFMAEKYGEDRDYSVVFD